MATDESPRQWDNDDSDRSRRRSFVWPLVAAFMTTLAIGHMVSLKRRLLNFERSAGSPRYPSNSTRHESGGNTDQNTSWTNKRGRYYEREGFPGREKGRRDDRWSQSWRESFQDMEELKRLERIRRMQEAFYKEREAYARCYKKWYEKWQEGGRTKAKSDQQAGREDWYWERADWEAWRNAEKGRFESPQRYHKSPQAHHYDVLGLDLSRAGTYSQDEIKAAFRTKAMQYHPDRNQQRKDFAEEKFREVLSSYEALKE